MRLREVVRDSVCIYAEVLDDMEPSSPVRFYPCVPVVVPVTWTMSPFSVT